MTVSYDGRKYLGWQRHGNKPTVQYALEQAVEKPDWTTASIWKDILSIILTCPMAYQHYVIPYLARPR